MRSTWANQLYLPCRKPLNGSCASMMNGARPKKRRNGGKKMGCLLRNGGRSLKLTGASPQKPLRRGENLRETERMKEKRCDGKRSRPMRAMRQPLDGVRSNGRFMPALHDGN